jgi:hypothetical protein
MTLEAPRPLLGAGVKMKKIMAYRYLNNFLGKKLFYIENLTKLLELTVTREVRLIRVNSFCSGRI